MLHLTSKCSPHHLALVKVRGKIVQDLVEDLVTNCNRSPTVIWRFPNVGGLHVILINGRLRELITCDWPEPVNMAKVACILWGGMLGQVNRLALSSSGMKGSIASCVCNGNNEYKEVKIKRL